MLARLLKTCPLDSGFKRRGNLLVTSLISRQNDELKLGRRNKGTYSNRRHRRWGSSAQLNRSEYGSLRQRPSLAHLLQSIAGLQKSLLQCSVEKNDPPTKIFPLLFNYIIHAIHENRITSQQANGKENCYVTEVLYFKIVNSIG